MKLWLTWIFYGLFPHCTFEEYKVIKNFVGPPRQTLFQELSAKLDKMEARLEDSKLEREKSWNEFENRNRYVV